MAATRVEFEEAIGEPLLLKSAWEGLSKPIQSALRIYYGLTLDEEGLRDLSMFREEADFDSLGYRKSAPIATDYSPIEHEEGYLVFGRRSAKTSGFLSMVIAYEAVLGGHELFVRPKEEMASFVVAQKLSAAQSIIRNFVEPIISSSKLLAKEIIGENSEGLALKNGHRIVPAPPSIKAFRSYAIPVVVMDECAFWYKDAESANPDFEVVRAVSPAQAQFPYRKIVGASTMWTKEGIIWEAKQAGMYGRKLQEDDENKARYKEVMVLTAPTAAMHNPKLDTIGEKFFRKELKKDPDAFKREYLNQAIETVSGMFTEVLVNQAIDEQPTYRPPELIELSGGVVRNPDIFYIAAMDPAFRTDDFAFTIGHYDAAHGFIQDLLTRWSPEKGSKLNPSTILDEIKILLEDYGVETVYSDQYQLESLQQLALDRNIAIIGIDMTANSKSKIFGSFLQLLRNSRARLIRNSELKQQLLWIKKIVGIGSHIRITAPVGKHDDLVMVTVLCCSMAIRFEPEKVHEVYHEPTPFELVMKSIEKKKQSNDGYL